MCDPFAPDGQSDDEKGEDPFADVAARKAEEQRAAEVQRVQEEAAAVAAAEAEARALAPVAEGWDEALDEATGVAYYHNTWSGEMLWDKPIDADFVKESGEHSGGGGHEKEEAWSNHDVGGWDPETGEWDPELAWDEWGQPIPRSKMNAAPADGRGAKGTTPGSEDGNGGNGDVETPSSGSGKKPRLGGLFKGAVKRMAMVNAFSKKPSQDTLQEVKQNDNSGEVVEDAALDENEGEEGGSDNDNEDDEQEGGSAAGEEDEEEDESSSSSSEEGEEEEIDWARWGVDFDAVAAVSGIPLFHIYTSQCMCNLNSDHNFAFSVHLSVYQHTSCYCICTNTLFCCPLFI